MTSPIFRPVRTGTPVRTRPVKVDLNPDDYDHVKELAERYDLSMKQFVKQALFFAIDHLEKKDDEDTTDPDRD